MVISRFLTILLLTNQITAVRIEEMKTVLEEDIDNMTEA